jgi:hypothetical protein
VTPEAENSTATIPRIACVPRAVRRMTETVESDNEGVALRAAQSIPGEDSRGPSVNVSSSRTTRVRETRASDVEFLNFCARAQAASGRRSRADGPRDIVLGALSAAL